MITSALPREGKTTTSFCLARMAALGGEQVVVGAQFEPTALLWLRHRLDRGKSLFVILVEAFAKVIAKGLDAQLTMAIVEAISAGLYVIASDREFGPSDLNNRPEIGQSVRSEDVDALASAMSIFVRADRSDGENETIRRDTAAIFGLDNVVSQHAAMLEAVGDRSFARRK